MNLDQILGTVPVPTYLPNIPYSTIFYILIFIYFLYAFLFFFQEEQVFYNLKVGEPFEVQITFVSNPKPDQVWLNNSFLYILKIL